MSRYLLYGWLDGPQGWCGPTEFQTINVPAPEDDEKRHENYVKRVGFPVEFRTGHLPNTSWKRCYLNLPGNLVPCYYQKELQVYIAMLQKLGFVFTTMRLFIEPWRQGMGVCKAQQEIVVWSICTHTFVITDGESAFACFVVTSRPVWSTCWHTRMFQVCYQVQSLNTCMVCQVHRIGILRTALHLKF